MEFSSFDETSLDLSIFVATDPDGQISDFRFIYFFPSQTIGFKIIQRNINTEKLNNTIRDEDAIKTQGVRTDSTHRLHNYLQKR